MAHPRVDAIAGEAREAVAAARTAAARARVRSASWAVATRASSNASSSRFASLAAAPTSGRSSVGSVPSERRSWVRAP